MAGSEILRMIKQVLTIDSRVEDLLRSLTRLEQKLDSYTERLARVELQYSQLRESLRSQIVGEVLAEVLSTATKVDANYNQLRREVFAEVLAAVERRATTPASVLEGTATDDE